MPCEAHTTEWHEEGRDFQLCPMKTPDDPQKAASIPSVCVCGGGGVGGGGGVAESAMFYLRP